MMDITVAGCGQYRRKQWWIQRIIFATAENLAQTETTFAKFHVMQQNSEVADKARATCPIRLMMAGLLNR